MHFKMGSQCKSLSTGVICSKLKEFVTTRAAHCVLAGVYGWITLVILHTHNCNNQGVILQLIDIMFNSFISEKLPNASYFTYVHVYRSASFRG